ncbi:MAG: alginate lyase family protein [Gemmatimonadota bacterium]
MQRLLRYARTLAGLSAEQLAFQVWRRVQGAPLPRTPSVQAAPGAFWEALGARLRAAPPPEGWDGPAIADAAIAGTWHLLGAPTAVGESLDWSRRVGRPLHSFHLQYHEQLRALAWSVVRTGDERALHTITSVVSRWMETTRQGRGDAWHPYPISVRVMVWVEVLALVGTQLPTQIRRAMLASLASQLDVLARRRERQIAANHLQRNDAALAIGGLAFTGAAATRWTQVGLRSTWRALERDVLPDGMHIELSPMYHAGMLSDVLRVIECCESAGETVPATVRARISQMASALRLMTRLDGTLHQFNDTAAGIAPPTHWLVERASRVAQTSSAAVPEPAWLLPDAGYAGVHDPARDLQLVFDAGAAGPRHQPGHAQCDALSFELCLAGAPVIVNAGVHGYDMDPYREYSRSTRGHNTVQVGTLEQHEVWATFRTARFGTVTGPRVESDEPWRVSGSVIGYAGSSHQRQLELHADDMLQITDVVSGPAGETARVRLLFHPSFTVTFDGARIVARSSRVEVLVSVPEGVVTRVVHGERAGAEGWYFPTFGVAQVAACVVMEHTLPAPPLVTVLRWRMM